MENTQHRNASASEEKGNIFSWDSEIDESDKYKALKRLAHVADHHGSEVPRKDGESETDRVPNSCSHYYRVLDELHRFSLERYSEKFTRAVVFPEEVTIMQMMSDIDDALAGPIDETLPDISTVDFDGLYESTEVTVTEGEDHPTFAVTNGMREASSTYSGWNCSTQRMEYMPNGLTTNITQFGVAPSHLVSCVPPEQNRATSLSPHSHGTSNGMFGNGYSGVQYVVARQNQMPVKLSSAEYSLLQSSFPELHRGGHPFPTNSSNASLPMSNSQQSSMDDAASMYSSTGDSSAHPVWTSANLFPSQRINKNPPPSRRRAQTFPMKLLYAIHEYGRDDIITWLPNGESFVIFSPDRFVKNVLSMVFKESKYASFIRKLHRWGFERVVSSTGTDCFYHPLFRQNRMDLVSKMACSTTEASRQALASIPKPPSLLGIDSFIRGKVASQKNYVFIQESF